MTKDDPIRELHQEPGKKHTMKDLSVIVDEILTAVDIKGDKR
jgi:hypothetical protein